MPNVYFEPSEFMTEIVGEASYQKAIREVAMYKELVDKDDMEDKMSGLTALLILEDDNKHDPGNAVRVDIDGLTVGYLDRDNAGRYRKELKKLEIQNEICTCKATAFGKRDAPGKMMIYGIWLSIDLDRGLTIAVKKKKKFLGLF